MLLNNACGVRAQRGRGPCCVLLTDRSRLSLAAQLLPCGVLMIAYHEPARWEMVRDPRRFHCHHDISLRCPLFAGSRRDLDVGRRHCAAQLRQRLGHLLRSALPTFATTRFSSLTCDVIPLVHAGFARAAARHCDDFHGAHECQQVCRHNLRRGRAP